MASHCEQLLPPIAAAPAPVGLRTQRDEHSCVMAACNDDAQNLENAKGLEMRLAGQRILFVMPE
eukprot:133217-Amphidinium_carterae.1